MCSFCLGFCILTYRDSPGNTPQGFVTIGLLSLSGCWLVLLMIMLVCTSLRVDACLGFMNLREMQ